MSEKEKPALYVGLDESNHGRSPEICVAVFSWIKEDASLVPIIKQRDTNSAWGFLEQGKGARDYSYLIYGGTPKIPKSTLAYKVPSLVLPYYEVFNPGRVELYLDGRLSSEEIDFLKAAFPKDLPLILRGFMKREDSEPLKRERITGYKNKTQIIEGQRNHPLLVRVADAISHNLYNLFLRNNFKEVSRKLEAHKVRFI